LPAQAAAGFRKIPVPVRPVLSRPRGRRRRPAPRRPGTRAHLLRPPPQRLRGQPRPLAASGPPQLLRLRLLRPGLPMPFPVLRAPVGSWPRKAHQHPLPVGAPLVGRAKERLRAGSRPPRGRGGLAAGAAALTRRPGLTVLLRPLRPPGAGKPGGGKVRPPRTAAGSVSRRGRPPPRRRWVSGGRALSLDGAKGEERLLQQAQERTGSALDLGIGERRELERVSREQAEDHRLVGELHRAAPDAGAVLLGKEETEGLVAVEDRHFLRLERPLEEGPPGRRHQFSLVQPEEPE